MSRLTFLATILKETLNQEYYDLHEVKYLWRSFFCEVRSCSNLGNLDKVAINIPTFYKESSFTDLDYKVSKRSDFGIEHNGIDDWKDYFNDYFVDCRITLDVLIYKNTETKDQSLFLSGFQKRFVRDSIRKKEIIKKEPFDFLIENHTLDKFIEELKKYRHEWTFYAHVFENQDKREIHQHIDNDESCEIEYKQATLADFMLFKDHIDTIVRFFEPDFNK